MNAKQMIDFLVGWEMRKKYGSREWQTVQGHRQRLQLAVQSRDRVAIRERMDEALRLMREWDEVA